MKYYSAMSDFEINREVAAKVGGFLARDIFEKEKTIFKYHSTGRYSKFDPCNSWADAGPIIEDNGITTIKTKAGFWVAISEFISPEIKRFSSSANYPTRAAMIVFLMMKDAE